MRSHAHFHWSLVIDRLNPQKADRSSPHQDLIGPIENTVVISCPIIFMMPRTGLLLFPTKFQSQVSATEVLTSTFGPQGDHVLAEVRGHV